MNYYSVEQASQHALEWCNQNNGWKRICDIEDIESLYYTFSELPKKMQKKWIEEFGKEGAETAWREFGEKPCKVQYGFVSGRGEYYSDITKVPLHHNFMMVYKIN